MDEWWIGFVNFFHCLDCLALRARTWHENAQINFISIGWNLHILIYYFFSYWECLKGCCCPNKLHTIILIMIELVLIHLGWYEKILFFISRLIGTQWYKIQLKWKTFGHSESATYIACWFCDLIIVIEIINLKYVEQMKIVCNAFEVFWCLYCQWRFVIATIPLRWSNFQWKNWNAIHYSNQCHRQNIQ